MPILDLSTDARRLLTHAERAAVATSGLVIAAVLSDPLVRATGLAFAVLMAALTVQDHRRRRRTNAARWVAVEHLDPIEWLAFTEYTDAIPASEAKTIDDWFDAEPDPFGYLWGLGAPAAQPPAAVRRLRETVFRPPVEAA